MRASVGEINIICTDLDRSLQFYRDVLGFEVLAQEDPGYHPACGETRFLLLGVAESARMAQPYCATPEFSVDLMVDDLAITHQHLRKHNVTFVSEWKPNADRFFIRDPDGLVFEVIQKSRQASPTREAMRDKALMLANQADFFSAIEYLSRQSDALATTKVFSDLQQAFYWQKKDLPALVAVSRAGVQFGLT